MQQGDQAAEWKQPAACGSATVWQYFAPPAAAAAAVQRPIVVLLPLSSSCIEKWCSMESSMERHDSAVVSVLHTGGLPGMAAPYYIPEVCWGMYCASAELLYGHLVALGGNLLVLHAVLACLAGAACPTAAGAAAFLMPPLARLWRSAPQAFYSRDAFKEESPLLLISAVLYHSTKQSLL